LIATIVIGWLGAGFFLKFLKKCFPEPEDPKKSEKKKKRRKRKRKK
jgi:hypothetical protein